MDKEFLDGFEWKKYVEDIPVSSAKVFVDDKHRTVEVKVEIKEGESCSDYTFSRESSTLKFINIPNHVDTSSIQVFKDGSKRLIITGAIPKKSNDYVGE